MKFKSTFTVLAMAITLSLSAQMPFSDANNQLNRCGTQMPGEAWDNWFNQKVEEYKQNKAAGKIQSATLTIPVIVHVIHGGQAVGTHPNISQNQVNSQITVLNADFAGVGQNVNNLAATAFSAIGAANCDIIFCPAEKDPNGVSLAQPGIDRVNYTSNGWANPTSFNTSNAFQTYMNGTVKPATIWDPTRYLNVWVSDVSNGAGLLGYATFPAGSNLTGIPGSTGTSSTDGIWVWSRAYGTIGTFAPYHRGRTATHELGHWLGLRHINGDAGCGNDFCNDTPIQQALNFGCPNYPKISCSNGPNGEMFMNFMDYCDDLCLYMFTPDQNARIQTAMANAPFRKFLNASSATLCNVPAVAPVASFTIQSTNCRDSLVKPLNMSTGSPLPSFVWSATPSLGVSFIPSATVVNPNIVFMYPGFYTVSVDATNNSGNNSYSEPVLILDCGDGVGFNEQSALSDLVSIQPNPGTGKITLHTVFSKARAVDVNVFNALGQKVYQTHLNDLKQSDTEINLEFLPEGVYSFSMESGTSRTVKRLVIAR
ncbi:MAG: M43 family zinc metalloprotease [Bacteroidia bacterium]|jgi:hypothetical protein|nr:M43 family zinc metalloprotease [Bacteroidia bacterium]